MHEEIPGLPCHQQLLMCPDAFDAWLLAAHQVFFCWSRAHLGSFSTRIERAMKMALEDPASSIVIVISLKNESMAVSVPGSSSKQAG